MDSHDTSDINISRLYKDIHDGPHYLTKDQTIFPLQYFGARRSTSN